MRLRRLAIEIVQTVALTILAFYLLQTFVAQPFRVEQGSMRQTLEPGQYVLADKLTAALTGYHRGDIVIFRPPSTWPGDAAGTPYIKRVIGLPGDVIQMRGGILEINGVAVKKERIADLVIPVTQNMRDTAELDRNPFPCWRPDMEEPSDDGGSQCRYPRYRETLPEGKSYEILDLQNGLESDNTQAFVVGEDDLFLMGDNRDRSADSRWTPIDKPGAIGIVPQKNLVGRALVSVFSTDGSSHWLLPWTWFTAMRPERIGRGF